MLMLATTAAMSEQFNKNNILILEEMGYEVHVAGNWKEGNPISEERLEEFKEWLAEHHGKWFHIPATRKPYDLKNNVTAYREVVSLIKEYEYEFIHCHTPIGSVIGRIAAHFTKTKVIYTAHGFHFFEGAPLKNWLIYYPVEYLLSYWTDVLILINNEDYQRALGKFHAKSTIQIPGVGVDTKKFLNVKVDRDKKRNCIGVPSDKFMLLSVGELLPRKNQGVVIEALHRLNNNDIVYAIAGKGKLEKEYRELINKYELQENVKILGFRNDIVELCSCVDCFIHPSIREGLGIAPLEAMAAGLPLISANIGGMKDYTEDGISGCCVEPTNVEQVAGAIEKMFVDRKFCELCGKNNLETVKKYDIDNSSEIMAKIYLNNSN